MRRKVDKGWAIDRITAMRSEGKTIKEIGAAIGLSTTQVDRYVSMCKIKRGKKQAKCPHCGLALGLGAAHPL